jgi:hypothetical protein
MPDEPLTIPYARLVQLVAGLGIATSPRNLRAIHITPGKVEVVRFRTDEDDRAPIAGDEVATETIDIRIEEKGFRRRGRIARWWNSPRALRRAALASLAFAVAVQVAAAIGGAA